MDNLINFDQDCDESVKKDENINRAQSPLLHPLLISDSSNIDLNNPFDRMQYRVNHIDDPFECLETFNAAGKEVIQNNLQEQDGTL